MCFPSITRLLFSFWVSGHHLKGGSLERLVLVLGCAVFADLLCWLQLDSIHLSSLGLGHL